MQFLWQCKNELLIYWAQWVIIASDPWRSLPCIKATWSCYLCHGRYFKTKKWMLMADCCIAVYFLWWHRKKAVDYMIEPIHCCKHPIKIALVFQGYPESLFVSWKAFDDKEVNRPAFRCVVARFSWRRKNELPILCTQWVVITGDRWWVLWCIKVIQSFYLYHGRQLKIKELALKANCSLAARFWLGIKIGCR